MSFPSPNIATSFHTHLEEYGHCDIVIDRMRGFPLREELKALKGHLAESLPLIDPLFMTIPDEAPLLVRLSVDASSLIESYLALAAEEAQRPGQGQAICAFLFSHLPCEKLAGHLTRQLDLRIKTGKRVFFRFFDPRVMHHLPRLLQPAEMAQLLNGIDYWTYPHWSDRRIALKAQDYGPQPDKPAYVRMSLSSAQSASLQEIETFNLALHTLWQEGYALDEKTEAALHAALKTAHACGLSTKEDRATLACHVISRSENILRQPQWQRALNLVRERAFALRDVLEAAGIALVSPAAQHE
ncbi:DUF4123 domain-containing protein [Pseudoduganella sp. R-31]|uniref:DUF4123 domain-containing protein n=1 Tax=Pseudoduganella sp. R-31 TaxID=3404060 RepID=UPI003CECE2F9